MPIFTVLCSCFHTEDHVKIFCVLEKRLSGGLDSNKTSAFYHCFSVFTMGNNSYGQCGRKVVEDETYR